MEMKEDMGSAELKKAKMHLDALKAILDAKGIDLMDFVEEQSGESDEMEDMAESAGASEGEDGEESDDAGMKAKKMAIILALKKKQADE